MPWTAVRRCPLVRFVQAGIRLPCLLGVVSLEPDSVSR
jgi:hypothetical protein